MSPVYQQFVFEKYNFDKDNKTLSLHYNFDDKIHFSEKFIFNFDFVDYDSAALDRACQSLFLMSGVSYYKAYLAPEIVIRQGELDQAEADFFSKTYQRGLGEFFYVNSLDPNSSVTFPANVERIDSTNIRLNQANGLLVGIGGGKDSLVSIEVLRSNVDQLATWSVGHRRQLTPIVERIGLPHYWVERELDQALLEHNLSGALNGHIPISAILACAGVVVAILSGRSDVIVSNEQSANEPTLSYRGVDINHQYSKSGEFESDFQEHLTRTLGANIRYYSLLRPFSELRIAEKFAQAGFDKYHDVFSSCNHAFRLDSDHIFWDGTCSKCAFVFLALTPFVNQQKLEMLFGGKNLLRDPNLESIYLQLLGIEGDKPLECVGEIKESRAAMRLASGIYPELANRYKFELPEDYDYKALSAHHMPNEMFELVKSQFRL